MAEEKHYPECEKIQAVREQSQTIGDFLGWLGREKKYELVKWRNIDPNDPDNMLDETEKFQPVHYGMEELLAEYFKIDLKKAEAEREEMIKSLQS